MNSLPVAEVARIPQGVSIKCTARGCGRLFARGTRAVRIRNGDHVQLLAEDTDRICTCGKKLRIPHLFNEERAAQEAAQATTAALKTGGLKNLTLINPLEFFNFSLT